MFEKILERLGIIERRLGTVEENLGAVEERLGTVENNMITKNEFNAFDIRLGAVESNMVTRDIFENLWVDVHRLTVEQGDMLKKSEFITWKDEMNTKMDNVVATTEEFRIENAAWALVTGRLDKDMYRVKKRMRMA